MTTNLGCGAAARASHGPGQENEPASAIRARPSPSPPSHLVTVQPVAGSSPGFGCGKSSTGSSRIVATQARNVAVSSGRELGSAASFTSRQLRTLALLRGVGKLWHIPMFGTGLMTGEVTEVLEQRLGAIEGSPEPLEGGITNRNLKVR